ncbi:MAG: pectate lyase [Oscillospiraceae bacterium]|nr:pectate lyase [Oscillospiraceae bacterium]
MKNSLLKGTAAMLCAALLMQGTGLSFPKSANDSYTLFASAAEADYPWSTYLKNSASWFGTSEAIQVAEDCLTYQLSEGGWQKGMGTEHTGDWAHTTIDNDATTSQIRFLMRTYGQTGQQKYFDAAMKGVDALFKMQYSNGGYMQCLNTPGTYHAHITLNDGAYVHVMEIMKEMRDKTGDFTAVSDAYSAKAAASLEKAIQCLLDMQIEVKGVKTAWCQQHDENTLAPASARAYELPSVCTSESAGVIQFLYKEAQATGRADIIRSVNAAIQWFKDVTLYGIKFVSQGDDKVVVQDANADPLWARFYDIDKQIPLFSDRDSSVHYDVSEISQERRTGYAWYGNWGKNVVNLALLEEPAEVEPEYTGTLISSLLVHDTKNGGSWSIQKNLKAGSTIYGDRDFTVTTLNNALAGAEYVQTACNSKSYSGNLAELTAAQDILVYVLIDLRLPTEQGVTPDWLSGWTERDIWLTSSNTVSYLVYEKELKAGETVTLGSNGTDVSVVNYFAAAVPAPVIPETTTTTTVITTKPPILKVLTGDVDDNGIVDVRDAVMLARIVSEDTGTGVTAQGLINAECDGAENIKSGDLKVLLQYLANSIPDFPV